MTTCPDCKAETPPEARFCPVCGSALAPMAGMAGLDATREWDPAKTVSTRPRVTPPAATPPTPGAAGERAGEFAPGTFLQGRFRITSLLGAGGMGSVYRAEDHKLGQDVALKFVNQRLAGDPQAIAILINEVRVARRVTHPNVCRVHDIGEIDGRTFISMEYVDGENLASLLRRIGRLPGDKALQTARQLCAGLHAAHEQGVLHRDLKPANIMLDGEGRVRITDFGIAAAIEGLQDEESTAGTPAYMAPELFTGDPASVASDVYSLGLVLYEIYTGKPLYRAESMTELLRYHRQPIRPPAEHVQDIDEDVERVIMSCLQRDPERRPRSAIAVLAALPGGDPLAEALASGHTPSPALVAAAGGTGGFSARGATLLTALLVVGLWLVFALEDQVKIYARSPLPRSADVLADRALEALQKLGYPTDDASRAWGFEFDDVYIGEIRARDPGAEDWDRVLQRERPTLIDFWYRQVPRPMQLRESNIKGRVTWDDPAAVQPGEVRVRLDPFGRLRQLHAVPDMQGYFVSLAKDDDVIVEPDMQPLLAAAGLDPARLQRTTAERIPLSFADTRVAWTGSYPEAPHLPIRVEAAFLQGRPVAFHIRDEATPDRPVPAKTPSWRYPLRIALVLAAVAMAWHSIRRRRGDGRGALAVWVVFFCLVVAFTVLAGDRGGWTHLASLLSKGMMHGLVVASELALYYFALEPVARRIWPESMISWSRLLAGRPLDPLVGSRVLLGVVLGVGIVLLGYAGMFFRRLVEQPAAPPLIANPAGIEALMGPGAAIGGLLEIAVDSARLAMVFFTALVLARLLMRNRWLTGAVSALVWATVWNTSPPAETAAWLAQLAVTLVLATTITALAMWLGLLTLMIGFITFSVLVSFPLQLDSSVWYSASSGLLLALLATATALSVHAATRRAA